MFNDTITIYNKYIGADKLEKWHATTLSGVYWNSIKGAIHRKTGLANTDSLQIIIPFSVVSGTKRYLSPKAFTELPNKTGFWTLQNGDTVIKGHCTYLIEKSSKELLQFDDVYLITSVDTKDIGGDMSHWEVSGK